MICLDQTSATVSFLSLLLSTQSLGFIIKSGAGGLLFYPLGHVH